MTKPRGEPAKQWAGGGSRGSRDGRGAWRTVVMDDLSAMKECPRFNTCSCNLCPLDFAIAERWPQDDEQDCMARRATREAIAARHPGLPTGGLTRREVARDKRRAQWNALSPEERKARLSKLSPFRPKP